MRKLRCNYKRSRKNILLCKWSEPEQPNGQIQYYSVKVAHGEELIYNTTEKKCRLKLEIDFKNDELYTVTISTVTYSVGAAVSTLVNFNHKSKLILKVRKRSFNFLLCRLKLRRFLEILN